MIIIKEHLAAKVKETSINSFLPFKEAGRLVFILALAITASACQITAPASTAQPVIKKDTTQFSQYYLWLKSLTNEQILIEEDKQNALLSTEEVSVEVAAQSKLILIYSLSTGALHQPYKAKRLLNEFLLEGSSMSKENLAFTMLLRDQLNIQLKLREKHNNAFKEFTKQNEEHHVIIDKLEQQLNQVNQQLILLKKIDQNINQRG